LISRAAALRPDAAAFHCNLADALRSLGRFSDAETSCRRALELQPEYPEALHNLGVILFKQWKYAEAEESYRRALALRPGTALTAAALADAMREQGRVAEALAAYCAALDLGPDEPAVHANYGLLLAQCGQYEKGLEHCRRAVALRPADPISQGNLGQLLLEFGRIDAAMDALAEAFERDRDSPVLALAVGKAWFELADYRQARGWFERVLRLAPDREDARCHLAHIQAEVGDLEGAANLYREILARAPACVEALIGLARTLLEQGDVDGAVARHREALALRPEAAALHAALGYTLSTAGDLDAAVACHRRALELNPNCVPAQSGLATTLRGKADDSTVSQIEELLSAPWMTDARRCALHFALAQVRDGRGDWARAAEQLSAANALQQKGYEARDQGYDPQEFGHYADRLMGAFTPEYFARVRGRGSTSERPVFIVGMPRSGTTLTEQVLATHPRVWGAGERRFAQLGFNLLPAALQQKRPPVECLALLPHPALERLAEGHLNAMRQLNADRDRVVDKMPDNYQLLGWIVTLFPNARLIHCKRDVRDVALSCWITNFARLRWANDLTHLAERINDYLRLMEHYHRVLPAPLFEVEYEQMVADQEGMTRRLLDFVGLEWDPACLNFHQTERLVRTASVAQVRQPIYKRSVARWRHYEAALRPLLERLHLPPG
jgi:tetratricopeptide (TPR) repeat protein